MPAWAERLRQVAIFNFRFFLLTEWIFVGIIALGLLGVASDRALQVVANRLFQRYAVKT